MRELEDELAEAEDHQKYAKKRLPFIFANS